MSQQLTFEIEFKSDFHVGAGHGLGLEVDSALLRDPDGVLVIRGSVLAGLLRDSLLQLLSLPPLQHERRCRASGLPEKGDDGVTTPAYCGQFEPAASVCPVCAVFGTPARPKRWRISSARPAGLLTPQNRRAPWQAGETAAQLTTRVRVNPRTRRAEENKLFTREEGDGSERFVFTVACRHDDAAAEREAEWIVAAARWLRRLGASKFRGRGECELTLLEPDQATLLTRFERRLTGQTVDQIPAAQAAALPSLAWPQPSSHPYRLQVLVRTDEPVLIAQRAEAGNQFQSLEAIPGSALRGAIAWAMAERAGAALDAASHPVYQDFARLFFADQVRFSSLVPVHVIDRFPTQGHATLAAPHDLLTCELYPGYDQQSPDKGHGVWSQVMGNVPQDWRCDASGCHSKLESLRGFIPLNADSGLRGLTTHFRVTQTAEMHIRLQPDTGRVRTGDLFGYVALEPGQYFVGEIACTSGAVWERLRTLTGLKPLGEVDHVSLGKANRRGYGRTSVVFTALPSPDAGGAPLHGLDIGQRVQDPNNVVLLLTSDAIVTDWWGRFARGFDAAWLRRELCLPDPVTLTVAAERAFSAVRPVDAFNAKLGLPRSRDIALVAGSCVPLAFGGITADELAAHLRAIEAEGIGLRRDEGFGQVAFNHPLHTRAPNWKPPTLDLAPLALGGEADTASAAELLKFRHAWEKKLDEAVRTQGDKVWADERFEAVARLIHVSAATSKEPLLDLLDHMGEPDQLLDAALPGRDKQNFYQSEDGKPGMDCIRCLLNALDTLVSGKPATLHPRLWAIGLPLLADRIAAPARQKAGARR